MRVIYNIGHLGNVLLFIAHGIKYHFNDEKIYLLEEMWESGSDSCVFYREIEKRYKNGITPFGKMIFVRISKFRNIDDEEKLKKTLFETYESIVYSEKIELKNCCIYNNFDEWNWFSVYMNLYHPKIRYNVVLMSKRYGKDLNGDHIAIEWMRKNIGEVVANVHEQGGAYTLTDNISKVYRLFYVDENDPYQMTITMDQMELYSSLSDNEWDEIGRFYEIEKYNNHSGRYKLLIIGQWFIEALRKKNISYFALIQQYMDWFLPGRNVILKIHPRQSVVDMEKCFSNTACIIPGYVPSHALAHIKNLQFSTVNALMTTGGAEFKDYPCDFVDFDGWYVNETSNVYQYITKLYFCLKLAEHFGVKHIRYQGIAVETLPKIIGLWQEFEFESVQWFNIYKNYSSLESLPLSTMMILGESGWNNEESPKELVENCFIDAVNSCRNDILYMLIDQNGTFDFSKCKKIPDGCFVIDVYKEKRRDEIQCDLSIEKIYLFSNNHCIQERLKDFRVQKNMYNMGVYLYSTHVRKIVDF